MPGLTRADVQAHRTINGHVRNSSGYRKIQTNEAL